jgi:hypothetical protein
MREVQIQPQSHFTAPNANVEPIGMVSAQASSTGLLPNLSATLVETAYRSALSQKGGDTLINIKFQRKVSYFSLLVVNIYTTTVDVQGTAARVTMGKQQIGLMQREQIRDLAVQGATPAAAADGREDRR